MRCHWKEYEFGLGALEFSIGSAPESLSNFNRDRDLFAIEGHVAIRKESPRRARNKTFRAPHSPQKLSPKSR